MKRKLFADFDYIPDDMPMTKTTFYKWLYHQPKRAKDNFVQALSKYLGETGFDIKKHIIQKGQVKAHRYVFENHWFRSRRGRDT